MRSRKEDFACYKNTSVTKIIGLHAGFLCAFCQVGDVSPFAFWKTPKSRTIIVRRVSTRLYEGDGLRRFLEGCTVEEHVLSRASPRLYSSENRKHAVGEGWSAGTGSH